MGDLVTTGAALMCTAGTSSATFSATTQSVVAPTGAATTSDTAASNVPLFGQCQSPQNPAVAAAQGAPQPCTPLIIAPWSPGSSSVTIGQQAALDDSGQCKCSYGGTISVSSAGQTATTLQ